tara:strand:+ start:4425 stop:6212 length:1788 start_codon:yes stop_codon:yes gene_type:complete
MPIIPSVFQPIKQNDVQQRPIKAYKRYRISGPGFANDGYIAHDGVYRDNVPHIFADTGQGVGTRVFPVNAIDATNKHVIWNQIDHRFYRTYGPGTVFDFSDIQAQKRSLWVSASIFTAPYGQVGEKFKIGTFNLTSSLGGTTIHLEDDSKGNLIDPLILSSRFASASNNFFYLSFNDTYREFNDYEELGVYPKETITYKLSNVTKKASVRSVAGNNTLSIVKGVTVTGSMDWIPKGGVPSGLGAHFTGSSHIRIPHHDKFDRFNKCDDWTISFWFKPLDIHTGTILTKRSLKTEDFLDKIDGKRKQRTISHDMISDAVLSNGDRAPFDISYSCFASGTQIFFTNGDGAKRTVISFSDLAGHPHTAGNWAHYAFVNSASMVSAYKDGIKITSASFLPDAPVSNDYDVVIGNRSEKQVLNNNVHIAEMRMYDYAVSQTGIESLADRNYISASLYQTNVIGNVFYKNGQAVVSSPLPKYNSGSGVFGNPVDITYRGTHTLYENEVLVRIPKDTFNVSMNPTSTYRPATDNRPICSTNHKDVIPGELRKPLFVSGTLKPYITTIGLYDDKSRMLATAKLSTPVQKLDDVDMNFIVRWDY